MIIFIPSRRRIEFLQKKIRQFNDELIETNVFAQRLNNIFCRPFGDVPGPVAMRRNEYINCGQKQTKEQPTTRTHVEIFLRFKVRFFQFLSPGVALPEATLTKNTHVKTNM